MLPLCDGVRESGLMPLFISGLDLDGPLLLARDREDSVRTTKAKSEYLPRIIGLGANFFLLPNCFLSFLAAYQSLEPMSSLRISNPFDLELRKPVPGSFLSPD